MSIPTSASEFFEHWVPSRLGEVLARGVQLNTRCSVLVNVGSDAWVLAAKDSQVDVSRHHDSDVPNLAFRVFVSPEMFDRFVLADLANLPDLPENMPQSSPLLKLFNLDDDSLALIQNIPGALQLIVHDGDSSAYCATLGPSSHPLEPPACTLKCSLADAQALRAGTVQPMELFFGGRLQLEGDPQVAMALAGLFL